MHQVERAIYGISIGDFAVDLDFKGNDEFGNLAESFRTFKEQLRNKIHSILDMKISLGDPAKDGVDLGRVLDVLLESSLQKTGADAGAIFLTEGRDKLLRVRRSRGYFPPLSAPAEAGAAQRNQNSLLQAFLDTTLRYGQTVVGEVAARGEPVFLKDAAASGRLADNSGGGALHINSLIAAPFVRAGSVLGVLVLIRKEAGSFFSDLDFLYLSTFADYASLTIENMHSYDEIFHLTQVYRYSQSELKKLRRSGVLDRQVLRTYLLRRLAEDSASVGEEELAKAGKDGLLDIPVAGPLAMLVFIVDRPPAGGQAGAELSLPDLAQRLHEACAGKFAHEAVDLRPDAVLLLLAADIDDPAVRGRVVSLVEELQSRVRQTSSRTVSCILGGRVAGARQVSTACRHLLNLSVYRFLMGRGCLLTEEKIRGNLTNPAQDVTDALRSRLEKAIRERKPAPASAALAGILAEIGGMSYNSIHISLIRLIGVIKDAVEGTRSLHVPQANFNLVNQALMEQSTFGEISTLLHQLLAEIMEGRKVEARRKNEILIDAIRDLVRKNYSEQGLCLKQVAATLRMSPLYLGKLFKGGTGTSVQGYITEVRLQKAVELLEGSGQSIRRIIAQIGMDNESYFSRLFRQRYGTTPKEYMAASGLQLTLETRKP